MSPLPSMTLPSPSAGGRSARAGGWRTSSLALLLGLVIALGALGACQTPSEDTNGRNDTNEGASTPEPSVTQPSPSASLDPEVAEAVADLAEREDIAENDITISEREHVTWPNGALGCPQPGDSYTQALVEGERLVLQAHGQEFDYHRDEDEPFFYCEDPQSADGVE